MTRTSVTAAVAVAWWIATTAAADELREADSLRPVTKCVASKPFRVRQTDRLPANDNSRVVRLLEGASEVSLADGYRVLLEVEKLPFVNLKVERSIAADFPNDKRIIEQQMRGFPNEQESDFTVETRGAVEVMEFYHRDPSRPTGSMITFFVEKHAVVATAYILNPPGQQAVFEDVDEYEAAKKSFTDLLVTCLQSL